MFSSINFIYLIFAIRCHHPLHICFWPDAVDYDRVVLAHISEGIHKGQRSRQHCAQVDGLRVATIAFALWGKMISVADSACN